MSSSPAGLQGYIDQTTDRDRIVVNCANCYRICWHGPLCPTCAAAKEWSRLTTSQKEQLIRSGKVRSP